MADQDPSKLGGPTQPSQDEEKARSRRRARNEFPQSQASKMWDAFGNPEEPVNTMPGGTYNTAGGRPREYTWREALTFTKEDFNRFYRTGCARDALLVGIAGGGALGGARFIWGGTRLLFSAANWSVGTFTATALGMYSWCEWRRRQEAIGMTQAVAGMKRLQEKKKQEEKAAKEKAEAARRQAEEEAKRKSWTNLNNYKFW